MPTHHMLHPHPWGIGQVFITLPGGSVEQMVPTDEIPEAVMDQWRVSGQYVLPMVIPAGTPPGNFQLQVTSIDKIGNEVSTVVLASVVPTLEAFTFNLLPGQNLISLPLKPATTTAIEGLLPGELLASIDTIMYYDASRTEVPQEDRWLMFSPDAPSEVST